MIVPASPQVFNSTWKILYDLQEHSEEFFLTGSRFFGNATPSSDWDFFAASHLEGWLRNRYFVENSKLKHYQQDVEIVKVLSKGEVQVQLVLSPEKKRKAQDILKGLPQPAFRAFLETPKHRQAQWWSWAISMVEYQQSYR